MCKQPLNNKMFLVAIILVVGLVVYGGYHSKVLTLKTMNINQSDWAFNNVGQAIAEKRGTRGVDINILPVWGENASDDSLIVAVIDSGVNLEIEAIADNLCYNNYEVSNGVDDDNNGFIDDTLSWNFYDNDNHLFEDLLYDYHGTYIVSNINRVFPECRILPVKFMKGTSGSIDDAIDAINYGIMRGARIINCCWNFYEYNEELYDVISGNPDILFICPAGNTNIDTNVNSIYPCSYNLDNVITVTAIDNMSNIYSSAGYGAAVDIAAPGEHIRVILSKADETYISGTSIATSFVTSAAAMILSENNSLNPLDVKSIILENASPSDMLFGKCAANGYINVAAAIAGAKQHR